MLFYLLELNVNFVYPDITRHLGYSDNLMLVLKGVQRDVYLSLSSFVYCLLQALACQSRRYTQHIGFFLLCFRFQTMTKIKCAKENMKHQRERNVRTLLS